MDSVYISYGADVLISTPDSALNDFGLKPGKYILQSRRLEPENNAHLVIEAYLKSKQMMPLVILGEAPMGDKYKDFEMLLTVKCDSQELSMARHINRLMLTPVFMFMHTRWVGQIPRSWRLWP